MTCTSKFGHLYSSWKGFDCRTETVVTRWTPFVCVWCKRKKVRRVKARRASTTVDQK